MKNLILISVAFIPLLFSCGGGKHHKECEEKEEIKVPESIEAKFASLYPEVKEVEWNKEDGCYEAEFDLKEVEMSASFDSIGNLLETEAEIELSELPANISKFLKDEVEGVEIGEASKITDAKGVVSY